MTTARAHRVDVTVMRSYHCITRCVRRAFLLAEGPLDRKEWIEHRLPEHKGKNRRRLDSSHERMLPGISLGVQGRQPPLTIDRGPPGRDSSSTDVRFDSDIYFPAYY